MLGQGPGGLVRWQPIPGATRRSSDQKRTRQKGPRPGHSHPAPCGSFWCVCVADACAVGDFYWHKPAAAHHRCADAERQVSKASLSPPVVNIPSRPMAKKKKKIVDSRCETNIRSIWKKSRLLTANSCGGADMAFHATKNGPRSTDVICTLAGTEYWYISLSAGTLPATVSARHMAAWEGYGYIPQTAVGPTGSSQISTVGDGTNKASTFETKTLSQWIPFYLFKLFFFPWSHLAAS